jgi:hypothetical protein
MSDRTAKRIRKTTRTVLGNQLGELLRAMLDAPLRTRFRYALIILFRLGRRSLDTE